MADDTAEARLQNLSAAICWFDWVDLLFKYNDTFIQLHEIMKKNKILLSMVRVTM